MNYNVNVIAFWQDELAYPFLSDFYPSPFVYEDQYFNMYRFDNVEQFYVWQKAILFGDTEIQSQIERPGLKAEEYKALGRQVKNFDDATWMKKKVDVKLTGLRLKFNQNEDLKQQLLDTGYSLLVEASPYESQWGISQGVYDEDGNRTPNETWMNPKNWKGKNLQGYCLMLVRSELMVQ